MMTWGPVAVAGAALVCDVTGTVVNDGVLPITWLVGLALAAKKDSGGALLHPASSRTANQQLVRAVKIRLEILMRVG